MTPVARTRGAAQARLMWVDWYQGMPRRTGRARQAKAALRSAGVGAARARRHLAQSMGAERRVRRQEGVRDSDFSRLHRKKLSARQMDVPMFVIEQITDTGSISFCGMNIAALPTLYKSQILALYKIA